MKIFVAKLAFRTRAEDLRTYFEQFGQVDVCKVIMDHETGRSKCYGFVEMPNDDEAYRAIVETDDMDFQGSVLQVKKSRPQLDNSISTRPRRQDQRTQRPHFTKRSDAEEA
ncbi:MAG: RNA-binding protein [Bacteroidales bacterium]|nr:RNA-binding protein [Bacteroidales bacterium]